MRYSALVAGLVLVTVVGSSTVSMTFADEGELRESHRGITLMAVPPAPGFNYDVEIINGREALDRIREALDVLLDKSPYSAAAIERLRKNGEIIIGYIPRFPPRVVSSHDLNVAAAFDPGFADNAFGNTGAFVFPVVVSRYLVKWKRDEIAAVLAHELVGHGTQHLEGRLEKMAERDLECEANLYMEKAFQDLGVDKRSQLIISFRQGLEWIWCWSFKRYMAAHKPHLAGLWKKLNPDVPELIAVFDEYLRKKSAR